jgi:hypothetical protein
VPPTDPAVDPRSPGWKDDALDGVGQLVLMAAEHVNDTGGARIPRARACPRPPRAGRMVGKEYVRAQVAFLTNDSAAFRAGGGLVITASGVQYR